MLKNRTALGLGGIRLEWIVNWLYLYTYTGKNHGKIKMGENDVLIKNTNFEKIQIFRKYRFGGKYIFFLEIST